MRRLVALVIVGALALASCGGQKFGPLAWSPGRVWKSSLTIDVGRPFSYGMLEVENQGSDPAVLQRLSLLDNDGIVVIGTYAVHGNAEVGLIRSWRPDHKAQVAGAVIPPHATLTIVLGLKVVEPGRHLFRGVQLDYRTGGASYGDVYGLSLAACTPFDPTRDQTCLIPESVAG